MIKKNFLIILLFVVSWACEDIPNEVVDEKSVNYTLSDFQSPSTINQNSLTSINFTVTFNNPEDINNVSFNIKNVFDEIIDNGNLTLKQNSQNSFEGEYKIANDSIKGKFVLAIIVHDNIGQSDEIIQHNFLVIAKVPNSIPMISNLIAPDSVTVQDPKSIILMSVDVSDGNGLSDISEVYFKVTRPDGTSSGNKSPMFDNGDAEENGDETADDGKYTTVIEITPGNVKGKYVFSFFAEDKSGAISEGITHFIQIL